ncbi:hypothetical protein DTX80_03265 [Bacilli bacterium]|uniref:stage II sporulation protein M n=1 Tax=Oceanobacillus TaxID=182709 RepID=UPI0006216125|nr:hypothetical protein WH51_03170 [Bacilli bacterium VT-13-104]PZD87949.1 hypothetical protein DEJ64_04425 [Bacilli bacterium]PZD90140.1 hypothetical protein DEJ60_03490 [Bacilli bacterium]PZD92034.1 hypothetical protein DEJ66_03945 [Bacilli bacterium]RCO06918.1 hypothetical protein DTX80_03265 [Bacilli bacterium]
MDKLVFNLNNRSLFIWSCIIYFIGILLSLVLSLILNYSIGDMNFNNDLGGWQSIFVHNVKIDLIIIFGGFLLGIPAVLLLFFNGIVFGLILAQSIINSELVSFIVTIAPHGVIENIGFLYAGCISFQIARQIIFVRKFSWEKSYNLTVQIIICIFLCLVAALIEGG